MAGTLVHSELHYENKWIRLSESWVGNPGRRVLHKEIKQEFINSATSWKKERQLRNLLDTVLHPEEVPLPGSALNQKAYELPAGSSLMHLLFENQMSMQERLRIATDVIQVTLELHNKGHLFCDLNPHLFWCDLIGEKSYLVDTVMTVHSRDVVEFYSTILGIEPHMLCMSPEQSLQTASIPDFRSNYYSVGIILYALFTGSFPLQSSDRVSTIHKHLSQLPPEPGSYSRDLHPAMAAFILKLLTKDPMDRYQSGAGLLFDFRVCRSLQQKKDRDTDFELGSRDFPTQFNIPDSAFFRKHSHDILMGLSERVARGEKHLIIIRGEEGSGVSFLLDAFFKDLDYDRFYIGSGVYSPRDAVPFKGLKDLTSDLLHQILMEDPAVIRELKGGVQKSIGNLSGVLIDFEKDFQHLFEGREAPDDLMGTAAINRFMYAYSEFLRLLEARGKSMIIALERFELADVGTTRLIAQILKSTLNQNILILISVNSDETTHNQNCQEFMDGLSRNFDGPEPVSVNEITLQNYNDEQINRILESLRLEPREAFAKILFEKTRGNLSFIKQLFEELMTQDYIRANSAKKIWEVDIHAVQSIDLSDNVRDFLKTRVSQLSHGELKVLKGAMAMGQVIEVRQLHQIVSIERKEAELHLNSLRQKGFLIPVEYENARISKMKFSHSGFAEILQESMDPIEMERLKLDLVSILFRELDEDQMATRLYELIAHLMPLRPESCLNFITHLEKAAYKAKKEAAFENASQYFSKLYAIEEGQIGITRETHFTHAYEAAICALYAMKYTTYQSLFQQLEEKAQTRIQQSRLYLLRAIESLQRGNHSASLAVLQEGLKAMGVPFRLEISKVEIIKLFFLNVWHTRKLNAGNVEALPYNDDEQLAIYHELINISSAAVYFLKPELVSRLTFLGIRDMIKNGVIVQSPYNLVALGFTMNGFSNMVARSHEICRAGFKLLEHKINNNAVSIPTHFLYSTFVQHTESPLKNAILSLEEYYKKGRELGNINIAYYCLGMNRWYLLFDGMPLAQLSELADASHKLCLNDNQKLIDGFHKLIQTLIKELSRGHFYKEALEDPQLPLGKEMLIEGEIARDRILLANLQLVKLIVDAGNNQICRDKKLLNSLLRSVKDGGHGTVNAMYHIFYSLLHLFKGKTKTTIPVNKFLKIFEVRAASAPFNYKVKYLMLLALLAEKKGRPAEARNYYSEAHAYALEHTNPWDRGLCCELYGALLITLGFRQAGLQKLSEALNAYNMWGAYSIVNRIQHQYPELAERQEGIVTGTKQSSSGEEASIQLSQLMHLNRAIYEEEQPQALIRILFDVIFGEASVEKAVFITKNGPDHYVYAIREAGGELQFPGTIAEATAVPLTVLRLAERRKSPLILGDAYTNPQYRGDTYINEKKARSLLCLPFVRNNQTKCHLYLENNLVANIFESVHVDYINLLYSQVSVAMDNSLLTDLLEDTLQHRSLKITKERDKADSLINNILPAHVVEELKANGKVKARKYDNVSVLFTDFKDFSIFSEKLTADQIIDELDRCFKAFDHIAEEYGLEKIKTIGDAYMCAGGLSEDRPSHEYDVVNAGLRMLEYIEASNMDRINRGIPALHLREGIHSGPLIAGVVGIKKYAYDIWGPTVNIASRMESSGAPGMLNISGSMYLKVKDRFTCTYRGKISAKNVGEIDMYFVEKRR